MAGAFFVLVPIGAGAVLGVAYGPCDLAELYCSLCANPGTTFMMSL